MGYKFLFIISPYLGHINPTLALAKELVVQGNDVTFYTSKGFYEHVKKNTNANVKVYLAISQECFIYQKNLFLAARTFLCVYTIVILAVDCVLFMRIITYKEHSVSYFIILVNIKFHEVLFLFLPFFQEYLKPVFTNL